MREPNRPQTRRARVSLVIWLLSALLTMPGWWLATPAPTLAAPTSVTIAGSFQHLVGCPGDWQPPCSQTFLNYDSTDDVWQNTFTIPTGSYEYKAALNGTWDVNYGQHAQPGGANIPLALTADTSVKFYYDDKTHWVTDNQGSVIVTAAGSFQDQLGCPGPWQPECLRSWLEDPDGDGIYTFDTTALHAGSYQVKAALNESWTVNYGDGGVLNGNNISFDVPNNNAPMSFSYNSTTHVLTVGSPQKGSLSSAKAHWLTHDTIAWQVAGNASNSYKLYYDPSAGLTLDTTGIHGGSFLTLTYDPNGLTPDLLAKYPYLAGYSVFKVNSSDLSRVPDILRAQIAISATDSSANLLDATTLQVYGVLDDLYTYNGSLGVVYNGTVPTLKLWAPTAQSVTFELFDSSTAATASLTQAMMLDQATGVWSITGDASWNNKFYLYSVHVYTRATRQVVDNLVTDPYSFSLSMNSTRSQIVNLEDPALKPTGWDGLQKPALARPEDIVLYELHIRDFSVNDPTVPANHRGTYLAFSDLASNGMKHLQALAQAGLTHVHILPAFDIASVNEDPSQRQEPDPAVLASYPPDSDQQAAYAKPLLDKDGFNWGYDPLHYTTPDGSYATNPDGSARITQFRAMVKGLNDVGLRTVMDVVYNHTNASGQDPNSVLDKVVPGYYQRLDPSGNVFTNSCCQDTASEHAMFEKLMIDSVVTWAKEYKVDGFRFDLMGFHMKVNMVKLQNALHALTVANDGVDGSKIYVYGEGWDFGEVANNARGVNATQLNMAGTGIGTFNDRLRDGVRGGGPFSPLQYQGFANGLFYEPNGTDQGTTDTKGTLLKYQDWIKVGMAGNLKSYQFVDRNGNLVRGDQVDYNGSPAGYTADPQEDINYVEAHDNATLFDAIAFKAPTTISKAERERMQNIGNDVVLLGQGVPFFQAGQDMLRSKSLDGNSYNSGDWWNKLDFSYQSNNFGVGLPPSESDTNTLALMKSLLGNAQIKPTNTEITASLNHFKEMLAVRKSSPLFRLQTAADVSARLHFLNNGPNQTPGLIAFSLSDIGPQQIDPNYAMIVGIINASNQSQTFSDPSLQGQNYILHPILAASSDPVVRTSQYDLVTGNFTVPAHTSAVFVLPHSSFRQPAVNQLSDYAIVSSTGSQTSGLANLVDNNPGTYWIATNYPKTVAIEVNFGTLQTVNAIKLTTARNLLPFKMYFQYQDSTGQWSDIPNLSGLGGGRLGTQVFNVPYITASRFRLVVNNADYQSTVGGFGDLQFSTTNQPLANTASGPVMPPVSHRLPVLSAIGSAGGAAAIMDGLPSTDWKVDGKPASANLTLNLGANRQVTSIRVYSSGNGVATDTTVQYWNGSAWVTIPGLDHVLTANKGLYGLQTLPLQTPVQTSQLRFVVNNGTVQAPVIGGYGDVQVIGY